MRLQRLEIAGFKSFPDRSELDVRPRRHRHRRPQRVRQEQRGRCAHVGAWRAERQEPARRRMEDVIFGGSDARKPTGAAEVGCRLGRRRRRVDAREARRGDAGRAHGCSRQADGERSRRMATDAPSLIERRAAHRPRRRSDAPAVPIGRERVSDRRRDRAGCATCTSC